MPSTATVGAIIAAIIAVIAGAVYFFGIPAALKREMEEKALKTMGENKASYLMKDAIGKVPASDQEDVKELKQGLGNTLGAGLQNPLGKMTGDTADDITSPFTGR